MSLIRQSAWAAAAAVVLAVSRFVVAAIIARRLSIEAFGQFAYGQWLIDIAFLACALGATGVAGRYFAECRHDAALLAAIMKRWRPFALGLPVLGGLATLGGMWLSAMMLTPFAMATLALWAVTNGLWAMQTSALMGLQRFDLIFVANAIAAAIMVAGAMVVPLDGTDPGPAFGLMSAASGIAILVGLRETARLVGGARVELDAIRWRAVRHYAINIWITGLLWSLVWSRGEMPIVRAHLGDAGVAGYAAALTLFGGAIQGVMLAVAGVAPQLTRLLGEGSHEQAVALARQLLDTQLLISGLAVVLLIYFSPAFLRLAFGPGYVGQSATLGILSLGLLSMAVSSQNHLLQIVTNARFSRDSTLVGLAILFTLSIWLVPGLGVPGAALARVTTMLVLAVMSLYVVQRRWGRGAYSRANVIWVSTLLAASAAAVSWHGHVNWAARAGLAAVTSLIVLMVVTDAKGRNQAMAMLGRLKREWSSASRSTK